MQLSRCFTWFDCEQLTLIHGKQQKQIEQDKSSIVYDHI